MAVVIEQQQNGTGSGTSVTTSAALGVVNAHKYLVFVGSKQAVTVSSVVGMGLTWTLLNAQCSGRSQTEITIFEGTGTPDPSPGTITANFSGSTVSAVIVAYRLSGVDTVTPILVDEGSNTNGEDDPVSCSGGSDDDTPILSLDVQKIGSLILGVINRRALTFNAGAGYVTETDIQADTGGDASSVSIESKTSTAIGATTVDALLGGVADWSMIAIELNADVAVQVTAGVDAILLATQTTIITVDSILEKTQTETILTDSILVNRNTETISVDSLLRQQQTNNVSVDSLLRLTQQNNVTIDSILIGTKLPILVDALLRKQQTETITNDSIIVARQTNNVTNDAILVNRNTAILTLDALLRLTQTNVISVDARIKLIQTTTSQVDANLKQPKTANVIADAIFKRIIQETSLVDARIDVVTQTSITVDAERSFPFLELRTVDAILTAITPAPLPISVDAILDQAGIADIIIDGFLRAQNTATANVDVTIETPKVQIVVTSDAIIVSTPTASPLVDAKVVIRSIESILADSILINRKTLPITLDGLVRLTSQIPVSVDATISLPLTVASIIDSILVNRNTAQAIADAKLLFEIQKQVSVDSNLRARIPLGVSVDSNIQALGQQIPLLIDALTFIFPSIFSVANARLLAVQAQITSIDAILIRANQITLDAKLGTNEVPLPILVDASLRIPRRVRTISEIRDNIFTTSIIRRQTRT